MSTTCTESRGPRTCSLSSSSSGFVRERGAQSLPRSITDSIRAAFADQEVPRQTYSHLIAGMPGDDAADHQHAAAAVAIAPAILLTANLKDFPAPASRSWG